MKEEQAKKDHLHVLYQGSQSLKAMQSPMSATKPAQARVRLLHAISGFASIKLGLIPSGCKCQARVAEILSKEYC